jgi:hypothetical protein
MGDMGNVFKRLVGDVEGKRPLATHRRVCLSDDKMDLEQSGYEGMKWINLAYGRLQWRALVN